MQMEQILVATVLLHHLKFILVPILNLRLFSFIVSGGAFDLSLLCSIEDFIPF